MNLPVRDLITERSARMSRRARAYGLAASIAFHVVLVTVFFLVPGLSAEDQEMPEYVAVQIVPAQMLGTSTPTPSPQPSEPRQEPPALEPEPEPEPAPETEPAPRDERPAPPTPSQERRPAQPRPKPVETRDAGSSALQQREGSPTGSRLGTSNFGAAVAGFDNPDFTYDYYVDRMLAQIRENWVRPPLGGRVEAMIRFRILKDGKVVDVGIARSSGYNSFDLAALRAVQSASPLPPLPQSFDHDSLGVNLVVR